MVEFALILPILVGLVFGIIEFSIAFNRLQGLHAAAREGARTASIPTATYGDVQARVNSALTGISFDVGPAAPVVTPSSGCQNHTGEEVRVDIDATYTITIPLLPDFPVDLTGTGVFRCE